MNRRQFLSTSLATAVSPAIAAPPPIPIIDTHIHLFDTTRPQGVPWPDPKQEVLYKPALPDRYRKLAVPLGVKGAIEIEASPWLEDNQWVLDIAAKDTIVVGTVGNIEPGKPGFARSLERFHRNPLFRGIRNGDLWGRNFPAEVEQTAILADLRLLSEAGLTLDTANPTPELIAAIVRITDRVPDLRIVIDHLPQLQVPATHLSELRQRPRVYAKISAVFRRINGEVPRDLSVYRATLDEIVGTFGEDRILYGSDWPNCDLWRTYPDVLGIVQEYFSGKPLEVREKYFWKNSVAAYRWVKRDASQPGV